MTRKGSRKDRAQADRHAVNRHSRDVSRLFPRLRALFAAGAVLTIPEACAALPHEPVRDVRAALSALHADGYLIRLTAPDAVIYARSQEALQ